jgi:hypothetical protein
VSRRDAQIPKALELPNALVSSKHHHKAYTRNAISCAHLYTYKATGDLAAAAAGRSARSSSAVLNGFRDHAAQTFTAALPFVT